MPTRAISTFAETDLEVGPFTPLQTTAIGAGGAAQPVEASPRIVKERGFVSRCVG